MTDEDTLVWSCFHDGTVASIKVLDKSIYEFTIEIDYLAKSIFNKACQFKVILYDCRTLTYEKFDQDVILNQVDEISKLELEMLDASIKKENLEIFCIHHEPLSNSWKDGILTLCYKNIKIYVEDAEIDKQTIFKGTKEYWEQFSSKDL